MGICFSTVSLVDHLYCFLRFAPFEGLSGSSKVRGVNLGGWLVVEGWIKPSLFDEMPNRDMLDGTEVQFRSVTSKKYMSAENGGGMKITVDRDAPSSWETFRLWRVSSSEFQLRTFQGKFMTCNVGDGNVSATASTPSSTETFYIERNERNRVHIKHKISGTYLQASTLNEITADYQGIPGWDDNVATFEMTIVSNKHRNSFITMEDFKFLSKHGINTVRIPVGWWIAFDPNPPAPFIGGTLKALDNAFLWARAYDIKCIIDLHAAPGSQNGMEHSASRDGTTGWPMYISQTLYVIDFLASRYATHPALLGIELLNEPSAATVPLDALVSYYKQGYQTVYDSASFGWAYWTLRNAELHWDLEWNIRNNYLQLSYSQKTVSFRSVLWLGLACSLSL
ncbi:Actin cross-linking [Cynara cardunculus var. scolymus]|uniref:Actin cross-linking n=1 Tax=Cynara cardunculus var. scolymus TaxID=59895 RepID=A0A103V504_CYNCS|nr:Actin cross-linking [Cynara cardunculus var. scolymus]